MRKTKIHGRGFCGTEEHYYADRGIYTVRLQVKDPRKDITEARRTVDVSLLNRKGILVDPRDGYDYKTVLIDSIGWMAQDLHHGKWLSMWERAIQKNNGIVERYGETDFEDLDLLTGYYNYGEAMNYQYQEKNPGICPPGWYIPDNAEWNSLINHLGEDKDPAIFLSVIGDEGVNLSFTGRRFVDWGISRPQPGGLYWSSSGDFGSTPYTFNLFYFPKDTVNLGILTFAPSDSMYVDYFDKYALTLRCVKKNEQ